MFKKLPTQIPVFPLSGVIYFPKTNLPLNIFEQRYLDLVNDTLKKDKFMGMIQSKKENPQIYNVGCLGKISDFKRSRDGKILINLTGLIRFEILEEINNSKLYREFKVNYDKSIFNENTCWQIRSNDTKSLLTELDTALFKTNEEEKTIKLKTAKSTVTKKANFDIEINKVLNLYSEIV